MTRRNPLRAALYARVSTGDQAETGTSLAHQLKRCRRQAEADDCTVVAELADGGQSGKDMDRTGWSEVMALAEADQLDRIYVVKPDRFARSLRHHLATRKQLDDLGVELILLEGHVDRSTPIGDYTDKQLALVAELERNLIRQRMTEGQAARAAEDKWVGGPAPYGYNLQPAQDGRGTVLEVDPAEARVVKLIYSLLAEERLTTGQVARVLNEDGAPTRHGARWSHRTIRALTAPKRLATYTGSHHWGNWTIAIPPLLTSTQAEILTALRDRTTSAAPVRRHHYLLVGRVRSPHGADMYGQASGSGVPFYRCPNRVKLRRPPGAAPCSCVGILTSELDELVWKAVGERLSDPGLLTQLVAEHRAATGQLAGDHEFGLSRIREDLQIHYGKKARVLGLLADSEDPDPAELQALREIQSRIDDLAGRLGQLEAHRVSSLVTEAAVTGQLDRLMQIARRGVASITEPWERMRILTIMDARVDVDRWVTCPTCDGRGLVPVRTAAEIRKRVRIPGRTADVCPTCHRVRKVAHVTLNGVIPAMLFDALRSRHTHELPERPGGSAVPFTVTSQTA